MEDVEWQMEIFSFFRSRMNQTIERMGLSRSILRFYLRVMLLEEDVSRGNKMFEGNLFPLLRIYIYIYGWDILNKRDTIRERDCNIYICTIGKQFQFY